MSWAESGLPACNCTCVTTGAELVPADEVLLIGPDLGQLHADTAFARIAMLHVNAISDDDQEAFRTIRDMEFVKYHIHPKGYMMRISPESGREQVRVSKKALAQGISFRSIGNSFIRKYKENKLIDHVRIIFVTGDRTLCRDLTSVTKRVDAITLTLNHIMDGLSTDCSVCSFKPVCDEVEGMRELHFKRAPHLPSCKARRPAGGPPNPPAVFICVQPRAVAGRLGGLHTTPP